jgi:hypothetical protein
MAYADNGSPTGPKTPLAVLKVRQAAGNFSICSLVSPSTTGILSIGDKVVPVSLSTVKNLTLAATRPDDCYPRIATEGYLSQIAPAFAANTAPQPIAAPVYSDVDALRGQPQPVAYSVPAPAPLETYAAVPQSVVQPVGGAPVAYNAYQAPQGVYPPAAVAPAPAPVAVAPQPIPQPYGNVPFPPQPNNPENYAVTLDFDSNSIADARLIRTFPLSQPDMNALEIQFRGGWNFYASQRYYEAFESFSRQSSFPGNYLSPYWAGMSALHLGDRQSAIAWFNNSLAINPYYQPARNAISNASNPQFQQQTHQPPAPPKKRARSK